MKQLLLPVSRQFSLLFSIFLFSASPLFAQPPNDDPCDAIPLTVNNSCNFETYTNAGATASAGVPAPGCANYNGGDVWFSVVVPCQGNVVIDTDDDGITDGGMAVYSGDCGNLTLIDCDDDGSSNGLMPYLSLTGLTPGETIYIRIWEYGNDNQGSFNICVTTPPPPGPGGSCLTAQPFCTSNQYTFPNTTGVPDAGGMGIYGCLLQIPNPVWYYMQVATAGNIVITIEQTNSSGVGLDVDYIVWGPFSTLQMSCPGLAASNIVSCSYDPAPIEIATIPNAQVGEFYVMLITNFDGDPGTITFQQTGGTGATTCAIICDVTASNTGPVCPGGNFDLNATTITNATYSWTGPNCWTSTQQNPTGIPAPTMPGSYTYTVTAVTPAGTSCSASTTVVVGSTVTATSATTATSCAGANDGTITITPAGGGSFTYTLNPGNVVQTSGTFTGLAPGTYSVSFADATGCTGVLNNISVTAGAAPTGTTTTTASSCPSATDGTITVSPGGSAPFSFTLNPGNITQASPTFTGLAAGTYTITFTNGSGCTGTIDNITVTSGSALSGTAAPSPTSCAGAADGSITVTPGIPGAYTYTLNPGGITQATPTFTGLATGTYSVTFTDSQGCTGTVNNITITAGTSLSATVTPTATSCAGAANGSIVVAVLGTGPFTYVLNPGNVTQSTGTFTGLAQGSYTIDFSNASGCSGSATTTVNAGPALTATAASTSSTCAGATDGSITITPGTTGTYTYTLNPGNISQTSPTFTNLGAGAYTIDFINTLGCGGTINATITAGPALTATAAAVATTCAGASDGSVTVNPGTPGTYSYTLNPGGITQASPTFAGLAAGNYTIAFTNALGCSGTVDATVAAGPALTASVNTVATTCPGANNGSITLTPGSAGTYTYILNPGSITQATGTFSNLAAGTYTITYSNTLGCSGTANNIIVSEGAAPMASSSVTAPTCLGVNDGTITISTSAAAPVTYVLNPGGISQATSTFTGLAPGTYSVSYSNPTGCSGTLNNIVIDPGAPLTATASVVSTSCPAVNDGSITVDPPAPGTITYTLNPGNVVQTSNVFSNLSQGTYSITFVTSSGCTGSVTTDPVVNEGPAINSTTDLIHPACAGINDGSITIVPGGTSPYSFTLNGPGGTLTQSSAVFTNLAPGTYNYTFTDGSGCQGSGTATLNTNPPIITPVAIVNPSCNGGNNGTVTFNTSGGVAPYQYSIDAGTTYQASATITGLGAGSHTIRVRDNFGCIKDTTINLTEPPVLSVTATTVNAGCGGNDGNITATGTGGVAPYEYSADNGTTWQGSASFTVSNGSHVVTIRDANGCTSTVPATVGLTDNMFLDAGPDVTICAESSHTFNIQTNAETNGFSWTSNPASPETLNDPTIKNPIASPLQPTTYTITATWGACSRTDQVLVDVLRKPVPDAGNDVYLCQLDSTIVSASVTNASGSVNYSWEPAATVREPQMATTWVVPDATTLYIVTVTDNYGCNFSVKDSVLVTIQPPVPAFAGNDTITILGVPHQLTGSGGTTYTWSPSAPLNDPFSATPQATLYQDTKFTLVVEDFAGCIGYDTVFVKVYEGPTYYVPNAFTPNGDGLNDIFRAIPVGIASTDWFRVFNRYGQLVFETNQWLKGWDGRFKGKEQPGGVYIWIIKGKDRLGRVVEEKGTVTLIR